MSRKEFGLVNTPTLKEICSALLCLGGITMSLTVRRIDKLGRLQRSQKLLCSVTMVSCEGAESDGMLIIGGHIMLPRAKGSKKIFHYDAVITPNNTSSRKDNGLLTIIIPE
ncbi:MAG: hypothetical protein WCO12_00670 [bacterium]